MAMSHSIKIQESTQKHLNNNDNECENLGNHINTYDKQCHKAQKQKWAKGERQKSTLCWEKCNIICKKDVVVNHRHCAHDTSTKFLFRRVPRGADARMEKKMLLH